MIITELSICDFRNLELVRFEPNPRFNVLEGRNGQGKTNVLEAIYVLGALKSFRASQNREMIRFGVQQADVRAVLRANEVQNVLRLVIGERGRQIWLDGKLRRSMQSSLGQLDVVLFAPEDLQITKGSPGGRRRFVDRALFGRWPASLADLRRYDDVLKQRNAVLKSGGSDALLDVFDQQLAEASVRLMAWRRQYLDVFAPTAADALDRVSAGELHAAIRYEPRIAGETSEDVLRVLHGERARDRARGVTSSGPHLDDMGVELDGRPARAFASQGQHRALVLAMKIAEIQVLQEGKGRSPVLLLDDVSSELDAERNGHLMRYLVSDAFGGQVFLTTTDRRHVQIDADRVDSDWSCFTIRSGEVR